MGRHWIGRLAKYGVNSPPSLRDAKKDAYWAHHDLFLLAYALWPTGFFRLSLPDEEDMEWFEANYPGWDAHYGKILREWKALGCEDPSSGFLPIQWFIRNGHQDLRRSRVAGALLPDALQGLGFAPGA